MSEHTAGMEPLLFELKKVIAEAVGGGMDISEAAKRAEVSRNTIYKWIKEYQDPRHAHLEKAIRQVLDMMGIAHTPARGESRSIVLTVRTAGTVREWIEALPEIQRAHQYEKARQFGTDLDAPDHGTVTLSGYRQLQKVTRDTWIREQVRHIPDGYVITGVAYDLWPRADRPLPEDAVTEQIRAMKQGPDSAAPF